MNAEHIAVTHSQSLVICHNHESFMSMSRCLTGVNELKGYTVLSRRRLRYERGEVLTLHILLRHLVYFLFYNKNNNDF